MSLGHFRWFRGQAARLGIATALCIMTSALGCLVAYILIWPAYQRPISRMYTSRLGYASILRKTGGSFPVKTHLVAERSITSRYVGEGLVQSEPIQVPLVSMARILKVHVSEGDRVQAGDLIVELDDSRLDLKIASARAALETARAELERVKLGTVNVLQEERPDLLKLREEAAVAEAEFAAEVLRMNQQLSQQKVISDVEYAKSRLESIQAELSRREKEIATEVALAGRSSSIRIAESAIEEAEMTLAYRLSEKQDYQSYSPASGIVERVLVHSGEYNQDPGRPAVLLASGLWFECYLDQTALGKVSEGDKVDIRLAAYQGRIVRGTVEHVRPLVNFSLGGPETNRPIRPLGTGAPEWPATFAVRVSFDLAALEPGKDPIVPGMTGYATIIRSRASLAVHRGAVTALSGDRAIVFVCDSDGSFEPRDVRIGSRDEEWVEICDGLQEGECVIYEGHQVLEPGDRVDHSLPTDTDDTDIVLTKAQATTRDDSNFTRHTSSFDRYPESKLE